MSEYRPVTTPEDLATLDHNEMFAGYTAGRMGAPEPRNVPRSFWHGWRNGMVDGGHSQPDQAQRQLAAAMCGRPTSA